MNLSHSSLMVAQIRSLNRPPGFPNSISMRVIIFATASIMLVSGCSGDESEVGGGVQPTDWWVEDGFVVEADSEGFQLPTAIAVVPEPGPEPKAPLYFVTELRGRITVVSNDGTVGEFARVPAFEVDEEYPDNRAAEGGLAGICLDPARGYVFVTFAYRDAAGLLRNGIVRFQTEPTVFAPTPSGETDLTSPFVDQPSGLSHQIGGCAVEGESLYVGVGDGGNPPDSQDPTRLVGKVLRLTIDGAAHPDNPYFDNSEPSRPEGYVFAMGMRNPFGVTVHDGEVYVADNGPAIDRFNIVSAGSNLGWDGTDWSVGVGADVVLYPAVSPVQLEHHPNTNLFPERFRQSFFVAAAGGSDRTGIITIPYGPDGEPAGTPEYFLEHGGGGEQNVVGLAFGRAALYFVPLLPDSTGVSRIYRVEPKPGARAPTPPRHSEALVLIDRYGCLSCHQLGGEGSTVGPNLDVVGLRLRLKERLNSDRYRETLALLDTLDSEPYRSWSDERRAVLELEGREQYALWTTYHLLEPKFDNPDAAMPQLGLNEDEAATIASFLVDATPSLTLPERLGRFLSPGVVVAAIVAFVAGGIVALLGIWLWIRRRRGKTAAGG